MKNGPLAGFPTESLKITLIDGSYHDVDSDALSFEIAASIAFKDAAKKAGAVIMEPIMNVEVLTPEANMGDVISDLNRRRGRISGASDKLNVKAIKASVPLSEMFGYVTILRTLSSGRATSTMEFSHYEEVTEKIAAEIISSVTGNNI